MNPFDAPPSGPPVAFDPPTNGSADGPRRGRMALVALLAAGLVGGGIAGVSQFASADRPEIETTAPTTVPDEDTSPPETPSSDQSGDEAPPTTEPEASSEEPPIAEVDGEIVLDFGGDEPIVVDLGDLDDGTVDRLTECIGLPAFDFDFDVWGPDDRPLGGLDELFGEFPFPRVGDIVAGGEFGVFDDGGSVTVTGPDGVSVVDLGESGSVTITKENGEISIETSGDATVSDLADVFGDFGTIFEGLPTLEDGEFPFPNLGDLPDFETPDPAAVQACIDEVLGR